MSNNFYGDGVVIHTIDTGTAVKLGGITSGGVPLNTTTQGDEDGRDYDYSRSVTSQLPMPQFSTKAIAAALAAIPIRGICLDTDGTHPGVSIFGRQEEACGPGSSAVASDDHIEFLVDTGLLVPISLTGGLGVDSVLSVEIDALTDGTNAPIAADYEATLPTGLDSSRYVLGHMRVANILFDDIRDFNLSFNVGRGEKLPAVGSVWADSVGRGKSTSVLTLEGRNPTRLDDSTGIPLLGKTALHAETIFYFRKRSGSGFVDDATTEHLRMTMHGKILCDNPFSFSGSSEASTSFRIEAMHDGTNVPIIFTPNVAYDPTP